MQSLCLTFHRFSRSLSAIAIEIAMVHLSEFRNPALQSNKSFIGQFLIQLHLYHFILNFLGIRLHVFTRTDVWKFTLVAVLKIMQFLVRLMKNQIKLVRLQTL